MTMQASPKAYTIIRRRIFSDLTLPLMYTSRIQNTVLKLYGANLARKA